MHNARITVNGKTAGEHSPVVIVLQPGLGDDAYLNQAAAFIRKLTGRDAGAETDETGTTVVYASRALAYPDADLEATS